MSQSQSPVTAGCAEAQSKRLKPPTNMLFAERQRLYILVTLIGIATACALIALSLPLRYPYANDTAGYVEEATNLLSGKGLVRSTYNSKGEKLVAPQPYFPPGFSVAIASLSMFGLSPKAASLALSWVCWALLVPAVFFALRPLLTGVVVPCAIAVTAASSPGLFEWGFQGLSDTPTLLLSVISIGALLRAVDTNVGNWRWTLVSGLSAGLAYSMRNAAVVLPATAFLIFFGAMAGRSLTVLSIFRRAIAWALGFTVFALPVVIRNLMVFGEIQPYFAHVGQSSYGWIRAIRIVLWSVLFDVTGSRGVANIAWNIVLLVLVGLPVALLVTWRATRVWAGSSSHVRLQTLALTVFTTLGLAMIAIGRVRFDWVETTLTRYVMQYSWALIGLLVFLVLHSQASRTTSLAYQKVALLVCGLLVAAHAWAIRGTLVREAKIAAAFRQAPDFATAARLLREPHWVLTNQLRCSIARDKALKSWITEQPRDVEFFSDFGQVLYLETGRTFRDVVPAVADLREFSLATRRATSLQPLIGVFLPTNAILRHPGAADWQRAILDGLGPRFAVEYRDTRVLIVRHLPAKPLDGGSR